MTAEELKALKAEIDQTEGTIRNLEHHSKQLADEAAALKPKLAELKAKVPPESKK